MDGNGGVIMKSNEKFHFRELEFKKYSLQNLSNLNNRFKIAEYINYPGRAFSHTFVSQWTFSLHPFTVGENVALCFCHYFF